MHYNEVGVRTADSMQDHHAEIIILGTVIYDDRNYSQRKPYQCVSSCRETQSSVTTRAHYQAIELHPLTGPVVRFTFHNSG